MRGINGIPIVQYLASYRVIHKENRYILEWNLLEKSVKRPFCCIVSIPQVYFAYLRYIWALDHHFIKNLKLIIKENQIMK